MLVDFDDTCVGVACFLTNNTGLCDNDAGSGLESGLKGNDGMGQPGGPTQDPGPAG